MKLSDHIKVTIRRDGESTCYVELDELMAAISDEISRRLENPDKITGDDADDSFVKFFCDSLREILLDMSEESFNEMMAEMVKKFGNLEGPSHAELDAKAIASGGVGGITVLIVDDDEDPT